ncbi:MAG: hypothetical protein KY468_11595 [Armatimonadetes bacterium]|nr:hypothetical protein [Armatimonadota bacterium]
MVEQCEQLVAEGVEFRGFCWFPLIDSTDWDTMLQKARGKIDPVGIYWLDQKKYRRNASMLSDSFRLLAQGKATSEDLPAYQFLPPVNEQLRGFLPQMSHWDWRMPPDIPVSVLKGAWSRTDGDTPKPTKRRRAGRLQAA